MTLCVGVEIADKIEANRKNDTLLHTQHTHESDTFQTMPQIELNERMTMAGKALITKKPITKLPITK